jgi:hypothetical protein
VRGCSALHRVMEHARTQEELSAEEAYRNGRGDPAHLLEKLAALGAHSSLPREIEVLYQMRGVSDEQGGWTVQDGRVNDLLGYPLAILV